MFPHYPEEFRNGGKIAQTDLFYVALSFNIGNPKYVANDEEETLNMKIVPGTHGGRLAWGQGRADILLCAHLT